MSDFLVGVLCTLNVTGETLVLKENFPSIKKGFFGHYVCKVEKKDLCQYKARIFPA